MEMKSFEEQGVTVLEVKGNIRLGESAQQFAAELQRLFNETRGGVVLDVAEIDYLDSTGIGEMVGYLQKFSKANRRIALFRPHQRLDALLKLTRLDTVFPVFLDREEALSFVRGG